MSLSSAPSLVRAGRAVLSVAGLLSARRSALARALPVERFVAGNEPHPLQPAAIRVERTRSSGEAEATQTAVTMWFGTGPSLPAPGNSAARGALRVGAGVIGAALVAALTTIAAQREARLGAARPVRRIDASPEPTYSLSQGMTAADLRGNTRKPS